MKQSVQLGVLAAANIGTAFLFQWYTLIQLGPGIETDSLFAGMTIPQLVLAVISGSLMHVLVPLLSGESERNLQHDVWGFLALIGGVSGILSVMFYVTAPWWVPFAVPGFDEAGQFLTVKLTRIQLFGVVFTAINGVQWAAYHARQRFYWAEFTPVLTGILALLLLYWALPLYGVIAAAWISVLRVGIQTILLFPILGTPVRPDLQSDSIIKAWQRIKPLLLGTVYYKTDPLVDRFLLSSASSGSLSLYHLAQQIYGAANHVINKAIAAPLVPVLSVLHKTGNKTEFHYVCRRKLLQVSFICLVGLIILGVFGQTLLSILIGHGSVSSSNVVKLWWIMMWTGGVFFGGAAGQVMSTSFYACGDTVTPTRMSILTYTAYIPCKIFSFYCWDVVGLAISTSIYYMANMLIQIYLLKRKLVLWEVQKT